MPEGPEIRRAADELATAIAGQRVTKVLFAFDHLKPYASHLQGETVCQVTARGKAILTRFSNDLGRATTLCKQGALFETCRYSASIENFLRIKNVTPTLPIEKTRATCDMQQNKHALHKQELMEDWSLAEQRKPLRKIEPLE